ncbi:MAG: choice-of-anchor D domain-containing protein [Candidatus Brocadiae bacterium]|nr:choice-of-anchor D domain-containing protein [Candidatus Brocadiia bacterium]
MIPSPARLAAALLFVFTLASAEPGEPELKNPYFKKTEWRVWRLDETPIEKAKAAVPPATDGSTIQPPPAAMRLWPAEAVPPGKLFLLTPKPSEKYAGTWDDVYGSWSGTHGWVRDEWKSPAGTEAKGIKSAILAFVDNDPVENHLKLGINFYHQSTTGMAHTITNAVIPGKAEAYEKIYFSSGLITSPCHLSLVEESAAQTEVATDLYLAYMPTLFNSVGSSDSETMAITKMVIAGAHLSPAMKLRLKRTGLYASAMLWLWKSSIPVDAPFESEMRHRVAYAAVGDRFAFPGGYGAAGIERGDMCLGFHEYDDTEHLRRMIEMARGLTVPPPEAIVNVVEHKGGKLHYALKKTICVLQEAGQDVELRISTDGSWDLDDRAITHRWKLLYGNHRTTVEREGETAVWKIRVPWDDALPEGRTTLILVANNGVHDGNPAAVNIYRKKGDLPPSGGGYNDYKYDTKFTNRRPIIVGLQDEVVKPGQTFTIPIRAVDPEGFPVRFSKRAGEPGEFDGNVFTWKVPKNVPPGNHVLTVIGSDGTSGNNYEVQQIRLRVGPKVHANIEADRFEGKAPLTVKFSAKGTFGGTKLEWAFAPRAPGRPAMPKVEATTAAVAKVFDAPGIYDAWLKVTGQGKDAEAMTRVTIRVTAADPPAPRPAHLSLDGNGVEIADGDTTPSTWDHTDFGSVKLKSGVEREFLLVNTGDLKLTLMRGAVSLSGPDAAEFSVVDHPREILEGTASSRVTVRFAPKTAGARQAVVEVKVGAKVLTFAIRGLGVE